MKNKLLNLSQIIDLNRWQELQDSLALATGMAIITVDYKGIPVTNHSSCQEFCKNMRENQDMVKHCQRCDSRGGLEAVRLNKPYIYKCHYDIIDVAIPIIVEDTYVGAIMAGQIKLPEESNSESLERITSYPGKTLGNNGIDELQSYYDKLPVLSYERVKTITEMLYHLCKYIVEEAIDKHAIIDIYEKAIHHSTDTENLPKSSLQVMSGIKNNMSNLILDTQIQQADTLDISSMNKILVPAFKYLFSHKNEMVSLQKMASICHISPSYFSRLFTKEMGENYSNYLSKMKIGWAKNLLEATDYSITQISDELGFNEAGYFIKIFKKQEGITPLLYRKYFKAR